MKYSFTKKTLTRNCKDQFFSRERKLYKQQKEGISQRDYLMSFHPYTSKVTTAKQKTAKGNNIEISF